MNWTGRSEDTEGTGKIHVELVSGCANKGAPNNFVQDAANKNLQSLVLERLSNPPEEVQSFRGVK